MNRDNLTYSFSVYNLIISFSCPIPLDKIANTILSSESRHLVLFLILGEMFSIFPHSIWCQLWVYHIYFCYIEVSSFYILFFFFPGISSWRSVAFCQRLFLHLLRGSCSFCPWFCFCGVLYLQFYECWTILASLDDAMLIIM